MVTAVTVLFLSLTVFAPSDATAVNPIRRVVTMLQEMEVKVKEEEEKEQALFGHQPPSETRCQGEKSRPQDQCSDPWRCCRREGTSVAE